MSLFTIVLAATTGYLFGSLSFARILGKYVIPEADISQTEFEVPGTAEKMIVTSVSATSISLRAGPKYGCLTTILDMLKVTIPTLAFKFWYPDGYLFLIVATMGVAGHNWPLYHRFRGGRGFSPVFGGLLIIDWLAILTTSLGGMFLGFLIFRDVLVAYMAGMWLMIPWLWLRTYDRAYLAYALGVNILFMVAMIPELKQYLRFKREGKVDLAVAMQATDMRHMAKFARRLGLLKEEKDA